METLGKAKGRREIYQHLSDYLNSQFISNGKPALKVLVDVNKVKVDESLIEQVVQELLGAISGLNIEIANIEGSQLTPPQPQQSVQQPAQQGERTP